MKSRSAQSPLIRHWLRPLLVGLCLGVITGTALLLLAATAVQAAPIPSGTLPPLAVGAAGVGALVAGLAAATLAKERGLLIGAACGTLLYLLLLGVGLIRFGGVQSGYAFIKWAALTVCGAAGGLIGVNRKRR